MSTRKRGRPRIEIDKKQFERLCGMMCTLNEIASFFDCSIDTIENWCKREYGMNFSDVHKRKSSIGKISLRRSQFKLAERSAPMAIFLGKNYLDQTDKTEIEDRAAYEKLDEILKGLKNNATNEKAE